MHNSGEYFTSHAILRSPYLDLPKSNFKEKLHKESYSKCQSFLGNKGSIKNEDFDSCTKNLMIASSCVLLYKANIQLGDFRNNVGLCKQEIEISQKNLKERFPDFPIDKMDSWLRDLSLSIRSFA